MISPTSGPGRTMTSHGGWPTSRLFAQSDPTAYGLSKHNHVGMHILAKYVTAAHEIGHNLGATHPFRAGSGYSPSEGACSTSIMWPGTVEGSGLTFCRLSREEINEYVSGNNHCLTREPLLLEPPTHLRISRSSYSATTFARVDLAWRDNSAVETGFIVERRRVGWSEWSELERTGANVTTFSNTGLFPGITYIYRVRAFTDGELSAYSNEVEATAASGPQTPRIQENWIIDTVAGSGRGRPHHRYPGNFVGTYGGDGGPALEADLNYPQDVTVDGSGNLYIADTANHRVRRVDAAGIMSTVAGTGQRIEQEAGAGEWIGRYGGGWGPGGRGSPESSDSGSRGRGRQPLYRRLLEPPRSPSRCRGNHQHCRRQRDGNREAQILQARRLQWRRGPGG